ncbi:Isopentenyldiphosphate isomerase [Gracilibacillus orientalis]|uniref:Isopentenyldiphosphate isomerase n=1 Tax=Gracilibacillus orientalis TaxID=334253 RepID=A0A1I4LKU1_9BACI|nr:NUDIX domain-containing protein [Gracilibacillus orientalis]SFL91592.1 Isopentenyldiphosphate isomerase [Gracilibacillus orientalis]
MSEELKIYDGKRNELGIADRDEVHKRGYWHETFQCWFVDQKDGINYIYLQQRSNEKKDFPNLFDITAAGHLLSTETVTDGVREIHEEMGIDVNFDELISLGVLEDPIETNNFLDMEWANVYLYHLKDTDEFNLQQEEVSGMVKTTINDFSDLCFDKKNEMKVEGFEINEIGQKTTINRNISLDNIVPHRKAYLQQVVEQISRHF